MYAALEPLDNGRWRLRFTRTLSDPPDTVWQALTQPDQLARWFPTTIEGDRSPGAPLRFSFPRGEAPPFEGEMLALEPPVLLELRWGDDVLSLQLASAGDGTALTLLDTFEEFGKAARDAAGWHVSLDALEAALGGEESEPDPASAWKEVHGAYVDAFGPQATTIGPPAGFE